MELAQMGCCAFNEIRNLGSHPSAPDAMRAFCSKALGTPFSRLKPGAFYIFTAVVKSKSPTDKAPGTYGHNFAALIKKHRLGEVRETMTRYNRRNVPSHYIQGWIWAPAEAPLRRWWAENGGSDVS